MRLTILGGSAAGPNPGQGCSGYLVQSGQTDLVLDLGPGTLTELRKHTDFRMVDAIVLSHLHLDHSLDILAMRYALAYNPISANRPIPLWVPPGGLGFFRDLASVLAPGSEPSMFLEQFEMHEYDPGVSLNIGELTVQFQQTTHFVPCWAMRVSNGVDGDLFYTADTGPTADLADFATGCEVIVAEGTEHDIARVHTEPRGHLAPNEAGRLAHVAGAGVLVLTHLWAESDPFSAVREAEQAFGGPVELATPGLHVVWAKRGD
jgi:ribonuclease BN (tRNA processing enzyme)